MSFIYDNWKCSASVSPSVVCESEAAFELGDSVVVCDQIGVVREVIRNEDGSVSYEVEFEDGSDDRCFESEMSAVRRIICLGRSLPLELDSSRISLHRL